MAFWESCVWLLLPLLLPIGRATNGEAQELGFQRLLDWIQEGVSIAGWQLAHPRLDEIFELRTGGSGRSLFSRQDLDAGATLALLPLSRLIFGRDFAGAWEDAPPNVQMAAFIAEQRIAGENSPWSPWLAILPHEHSLPKHWEPSFLNHELQGSAFPDVVRQFREAMANEWVTWLAGKSNISWEDYEWAHDVMSTRSLFWNSSWVEGYEGRGALFPLLDLMQHGHPANVGIEFDEHISALRIRARQSITSGEELYFAYFEDLSRSNFEILSMWGFAVTNAARLMEFKVQLKSGRLIEVGLASTVEDGAARYLLGQLRIEAASGQQIRLPKALGPDWMAIADVESGMFYYFNARTNESTWERPGGLSPAAEQHEVPRTTWGVEAAALHHGLELFTAALAKYPQTLAEDEALIAAGSEDTRLRYMVLLRRDEKIVLSWWLRVLSNALTVAEGQDPEAEVDHGNPEANLQESLQRHRLWPHDEL